MLKKNSKKPLLPFYTVDTLKNRLEWVINLRWLIVFGLFAMVPLSQRVLQFSLGYYEIVIIACVILVINLIFFFLLRYLSFKTELQELIFAEIQILIDLILLSCLVHYAGGIDNPFYFILMIVVMISGFLFPNLVVPVINGIFASALLTAWSLLEYHGVIRAYELGGRDITLSYLITSQAAFIIMTFIGVYIINNFVFTYRNMKTIIDEKNQLLEKNMDERRDIFRYAAHELKTPISTIQSTLLVIQSLFVKENVSPDMIDLVSRAENRSQQVLDMVNEMIEITKYKEGIKVPDFECVFFSAWIKYNVQNQVPNAISKNIQLIADQLDREHTICFDRSEMDKVFINLLSNALRYTPAGGTVRVIPFIDSKHFGFKVQDTGIGISKEDQVRIFNEFYRTADAKKMERTGTGLGLNLVREIVQKHHGEIRVESKPGEGSTFIVTLPMTNKSSGADPRSRAPKISLHQNHSGQ